jgi:hypothetical protein
VYDDDEHPKNLLAHRILRELRRTSGKERAALALELRAISETVAA